LETSITNVLDVNRGVENPDLASGSTWMLSFIPMMVIMLIFSSCVTVAPESIAGEKERGTFATLLVTPISRTAIAIGKIISLSVFAIMGGLSSFVGLILGTKGMLDSVESSIPVYGSGEYIWLLLLIVSAVMMTVAIISVISAFAKSVKGATSASGLVLLVGSVGSMVNMLPFAFSGIGWRCVPVLGTAISLNDLIMLEYSVNDIAATCVSNLVVTTVLVFVLSKMFNSEKIMFSK
jgi:sodium transport system permease protein